MLSKLRAILQKWLGIRELYDLELQNKAKLDEFIRLLGERSFIVADVHVRHPHAYIIVAMRIHDKDMVQIIEANGLDSMRKFSELCRELKYRYDIKSYNFFIDAPFGHFDEIRRHL